MLLTLETPFISAIPRRTWPCGRSATFGISYLLISATLRSFSHTLTAKVRERGVNPVAHRCVVWLVSRGHVARRWLLFAVISAWLYCSEGVQSLPSR